MRVSGGSMAGKIKAEFDEADNAVFTVSNYPLLLTLIIEHH